MSSRLKQLLDRLTIPAGEPAGIPDAAAPPAEPGGDDAYFNPPPGRLVPTLADIDRACERQRARLARQGRFPPGRGWPIDRLKPPRRRRGAGGRGS